VARHDPERQPPTFSASSVLQAVGSDLHAIWKDAKAHGGTWDDIGAELGVSPDQAAKYADGTATMNLVTYARGKREWGGRFSGSLDRLCEQTRIKSGDDRERECVVLKAALALSEALRDGKLTDDEIRKNRPTLEAAKQAIEEVLARSMVRAA
jgi:hypothetical protein